MEKKRRGLSWLQKLGIAVLWILFCLIIFLVSPHKSWGENITIVVISGLLIIAGINMGQDKFNKTMRRK